MVGPLPQELPSGGLCDFLLYTGIILLMIGLILSVLGLGEKGFTSAELRMVGPVIVFTGLILALARIFSCAFNCSGLRHVKEPEEKESLIIDENWDDSALWPMPRGDQSMSMFDKLCVVKETDILAMTGRKQDEHFCHINS